jgi:hypothetical protein
MEFRQAIGNIIDDATNSQRRGEIQDIESFVRITERILEHGFISNKALFTRGRSVWEFIESTLNSPDIITTVVSLTEHAPSDRVQVYIQTALVQQSLGNHMSCFYADDSILSEWYQPSAIMRDPDYKTPILGLLSGLNRIELNIHVKERR